MQTEQEKYQIIEKFCNEVQPKVFSNLAATDHNVNLFKACLDSNWSSEISIEFLTQIIRSFSDKFQWLQAEPAALSSKERRALVGLPEDSWRPDNPAEARKKREAEEAKAKRDHELDPKNIQKAQQECEEIARNAQTGSHSDNAAIRALLNDTWVYVNTPVGKRIDYFRSLELRKELYNKAVNNKSVSTHVKAW